MSKAIEAFRTISEVADDLDVPKHVLRFWEIKFPQIRPMKRGGGRRYYRPEDLILLRGVRQLLHAEGYTIKGVQKILREQGIEHVKRYGGDRPPLAPKSGGRKRTTATTAATAAPEAVTQPRSAKTVAGALSAKEAARKAAAGAVMGTSTQVLKAAIAELLACRTILLAAAKPEHVAETTKSRVGKTA